MRIVTLNTWSKYGSYQQRFNTLLNYLNLLKPDLICLQEVFDSELVGSILASGVALHAHPNYEAGLVVLSRHQISSAKFIAYKHQSPQAAFPRGAILVRIGSKSARFYAATTHLDWKANEDAIRTKQADELADQTSTLNKPVVLTGDFNCTPDSNPMLHLKKRGFIDLEPKLKPAFTWDNDRNPYLKGHSTFFPNRRIDFILADQAFSSQFSWVKTDLVFTEPFNGHLASDHFGVLADFE